MKKVMKNSNKKTIKENNLKKFINKVKEGKYTDTKVNSNMRVPVYETNYNEPTYTFGVR